MGSFLQTMALSMGIGVLKMALPFISQELRKLMVKGVNEWDAYARQTPYDWDNQVVDAVRTLLCISDPEPQVQK